MKIVIQRSKKSKVSIKNVVCGSIDSGMVLLVCFEKGDDGINLDKVCEKLLALRIFEDDSGKMNRNITETNGSILAISQFTLSWDGLKGNRPSFDQSMSPHLAKEMFEKFIITLRRNIKVETGVFGESMQVEICNDGPVTFSLNFK